MRRIIKSSLCIVLIICFAFSLTGCKKLDNLKESQAFWNNKEKTEIVLGGKIYKKLPDCEEFMPNTSCNDGTYVTEKDVPVLLASYFNGTQYSITKAKDLLRLDSFTSYARADKYEEYKELIENYKLDCYGVYMPHKSEHGGMLYDLGMLKGSEAEIIDKALTTAAKETEPSSKEEYFGERCDISWEITSVDSTMNFSRYLTTLFYYSKENKICFNIENDYYTVLPEYTSDVAMLMEKYCEKY